MNISKPVFWVDVAGVCLVLVSFFRGQYLLGIWAGLIVGAIAALLSWSLTRTIKRRPSYKRWRIWASCVVVLLFSIVLWMPPPKSTVYSMMVEEHRTKVNARAQVEAVFNSDPRYRDLTFENIGYGKGTLFTTIKGQVPERDDIAHLESRIRQECPDLSIDNVTWYVH